eukprot:1161556-Pelagomonas_calceolata.AAC.16
MPWPSAVQNPWVPACLYRCWSFQAWHRVCASRDTLIAMAKCCAKFVGARFLAQVLVIPSLAPCLRIEGYFDCHGQVLCKICGCPLACAGAGHSKPDAMSARAARDVKLHGAGHPKPDTMSALAARDTVIAMVKSVFGGRHGAVAMSSLQQKNFAGMLVAHLLDRPIQHLPVSTSCSCLRVSLQRNEKASGWPGTESHPFPWRKSSTRGAKKVGYARTPPPHRDAVHLLTQGGALLALRRDLRTPFVHWMAQHAAEHKRFDTEKVDKGGMLHVPALCQLDGSGCCRQILNGVGCMFHCDGVSIVL